MVLTINKSNFKENVITLTAKIAVINESIDINLYKLSKILNHVNIKELNIFSIHKSDTDSVFIINEQGSSITTYIEVGIEDFLVKLDKLELDFFKYNKNSLYIIRDANFVHIKNLIKKINNCNVNIGRGGSQKSHILSPLDLRLSSYLMAMFNFNYDLLSSLNTFNFLSKDRYLPFIETSDINTRNK